MRSHGKSTLRTSSDQSLADICTKAFEVAQTITSYMCKSYPSSLLFFLFSLDNKKESDEVLTGVRTMFIGIHITDLPAGLTLETGMSWNFAAQLVYNPILACVKCSVLQFLLRLGGGLDKKIRWCIYGVGTVTVLQMCIIFLLLGLQCRPIHYYWTRYSLTGTHQGAVCINLPAFYISTASITVVTDLLVLALPLWIFLGLKMKKKVKIMVLSLFFLGGG